uniref:Secreted protein n=1 Tax=Steinernema glaseri TaxID=37863 RepID=A0A1I7Z3F8_9BILA
MFTFSIYCLSFYFTTYSPENGTGRARSDFLPAACGRCGAEEGANQKKGGNELGAKLRTCLPRNKHSFYCVQDHNEDGPSPNVSRA